MPHAIGKNCFLAELQEPTDLMVIPERVTPSGVVLSEQKLHCGLGFERMFDCFSYDGTDKEAAYMKYFIKPEKISGEVTELINCDKFRLNRINVNGEFEYETDSYAVAVVINGNVCVNGISLKAGDRVFVSENERNLVIKGTAEILICRP